MTENNHHIAGLIGKYLDDSLNDEERIALEEWVNASGNNRDLFAAITDRQQLRANVKRFYAYDTDRISRKISAQIPEFGMPSAPQVHRIHFLRKWGWAAAAAFLIGGSVSLWMKHNKKTQPAIVASQTMNIAPGSQGAILTLADGREVVLDSMASGVVAHQSGTSVVLSNGNLVYDGAGENTAEIQYNKMTTPKGRQFQLTLPDGTRVWLNAASSIRYPITFTGNERRVEISGEVCFDVVKDVDVPFRVTINNNKASIEVLGTLFNVNAYENENAIQTTLLNGSVRVGIPSPTHTAGVILKPGQQAVIRNAIGVHTPEEKITVLNDPEIEKIMAWKNGLFNFEGANLEEVMRQLERWYNIDVVYENGIPNIQFMGEMSRQIPLTDLLEILRRTEVDFRVEGRKLIVLNK
ncbi:FecR family protein [Chitinophaga arvensicola]|uniref:FecR protein n=1 Tax=Chitinophaga arvensicola TaxID=29529 RepID=A0A1I0R4L3_9BACT|nr:FecR family protein [Chitinophaga arvensicola]SEW35234.1 FecR protein [Chitinophaga arvensicola]